MRRRIPDTLQKLLIEPQKFGIHQALRVIETQWLKNSIAHPESKIYLSPACELSFPASDIRRSRIDSHGKISLELNFMGLYGVDSPLPLYFSQLAAQDNETAKRIRRLLEIINQKIYVYHYLAWRQQNYLIRSEQHEEIYPKLLAQFLNISYNHNIFPVLNYFGIFFLGKT